MFALALKSTGGAATKGRGFHSVSTPLSGGLIGEFRKVLISFVLG